MKPPIRPALTVALLSLIASTGWIGLRTRLSYGGRLTGLYYTGAKTALPPELDGAHTARTPDERGYDAQFYHVVAHDPLLRRGFGSYVDNARLRWRRIGVPGLAAAVTFGSNRWVDTAYVAVELVFLFLGAFWLSRFAQRFGRSAAWGFAFLAVPAVLVSLDRMTIDLPLAALSVGFGLYATAPEPRDRRPLYAVLAAAPLVRETGLLLVISWIVCASICKAWRAAVAGAACAVPALAWWGFVVSRTFPDATSWIADYPFAGIIDRTLRGSGASGALGLRIAGALETVALAGLWLALLCCAYLAWKRRWGILEITALVSAAFAAVVGFDVWADAYGAGRTMSPLLVMLALIGIRDLSPAYLAPIAAILPRIALQYWAEIRMALRS